MIHLYPQFANLLTSSSKRRLGLLARRSWALLAAYFLALCLLPGQAPYTEPRYGWRVEQGIVYGQAADYGGVERELRMDIYKPVCDFNPARPLFVIVHGGAFLRGDEGDGDVVALCRALASRGAVAASISYRLGFHLKGGSFDPGLLCNAELKCLQALDSAEVTRAVYRGMQDARGAIRFLKGRHVQDSTDVDNVFIGGSSAGGFIALYAGYLDPEEKPEACYALPDAPPPSPFFPGSCSVASASRARPDLGSTEGGLHLGNGYDASVRGVANFMGGMMEDILPGPLKPALYLYHQTDDLVVSYRYARPFSLLRQYCEVAFAFCTPLFSSWPLVHGSFDIQSFATALGGEAPLVYTDIINNGSPSTLSCLTGNNHSIVNIEERVDHLMSFWGPLIAASGNTGAGACPPQFEEACSGSLAQAQVFGDPQEAPNQPYGLLALPDSTFLAAGEWNGEAALLRLGAQGDSLGRYTYGALIGGASSTFYSLARLEDGSIIAVGQCSGCGPEDEQERSLVLKLDVDLIPQQFRILGKPAACDNCLYLNRYPVLLADAERIIVVSELGIDNPLNFSDLNFTVLSHQLEVEHSTRVNFRGFDRPFAVLPSGGNYMVLANHPLSEFGVSFALFNPFGSLLNTTPPRQGVEGSRAILSGGMMLVAGRTLDPDGDSDVWLGLFRLSSRQLIDELSFGGDFNDLGVTLASLGSCRALLGTRQAQPNPFGTYQASYIYRLQWCGALQLTGSPDTIPNPDEFTSMDLRGLAPLDDSGFRYLAIGRRGFNPRTFAYTRYSVPLSGQLLAIPPACAGGADGAIATDAQGVPPLAYAWTGNSSTASMLSGLSAGTYAVTITDGACQSLVLEADLPDGPALDLAIGLSGDTLTAAQANVDYQWIDCGTGQPIVGAVQPFFVPSASGSYAVLLSLGNCQLRSDCALVVNTAEPNELPTQARALPNPNQGSFILELPWPAETILYDAMGRRLSTARYAAGQHLLALDAPAGVYLLVLRHSAGVQVVRVVKR